MKWFKRLLLILLLLLPLLLLTSNRRLKFNLREGIDPIRGVLVKDAIIQMWLVTDYGNGCGCHDCIAEFPLRYDQIGDCYPWNNIMKGRR